MDGSRKHIMTRLPDTGKVTLMTFAGKYKYLTVTGCILSGISAGYSAGAVSVHVEG